MIQECRHIRAGGQRCRAIALKHSHWCYYHTRLHRQQTLREEAARLRRKAGSRKPRVSDIAALSQKPDALIGASGHRKLDTSHADSDTYAETASFNLPTPEDSASIQLALIEVLQSLAANQLDPKRAGLLLYGLQVASANARNFHINSDEVRTITYTNTGIPLAPAKQLGR